MNTEQFIRDSAARGLSRRATRLSLGIGPWVFREMLTLMPDIEWPARGCSADHQRANEQKRGRCTPAQAAALERAHERWSESRRFTVDGVTGTIAELVEHFQSPVHAATVRRRVAAGMSLRDALTTPRQQPKPGRRHPWNRSKQEHALSN
ncbi:hypothetical protein [Pseudomonas aeruginosa]|uniref:hypothetical protein n=1 Tax=Pseudomonas aeruginosa TaxID=287 RepID=UPI000F51D80B|nr:hypothetical protein [Pseudomonas aeruginosa]MCO7704996.1 hypothetical protein [Pseudomonas aeruginosa]MCO7714741.1 hypothetical protein [Pseudomonas aeruginosa]MCO7720459.1 hypothetical protein [Pseudomonas aeruginosa]MCO7733877.1 hypothetical protein [Pseudomonas aeruginosa]MCO7754012.1 hypothetical protein [Pseudomonas aeruginosa]